MPRVRGTTINETYSAAQFLAIPFHRELLYTIPSGKDRFYRLMGEAIAERCNEN